MHSKSIERLHELSSALQNETGSDFHHRIQATLENRDISVFYGKNSVSDESEIC